MLFGSFSYHTSISGNGIYDDKNKSKRSLHILEDGASGVQVGDIDQTIL